MNETVPAVNYEGRFVLGYLPGTRSRIDPSRPQVWIEFTSMMRGVRYHFERFERGDRGAFLARLRVYDSADFPPELISSLMQSRHIVPYAAAPRNLVTPDKLRLECRL